MKAIVIQEVQVKGFKGFKDERTFTLHQGLNQFSSDNAKGKTSIGEAICWAFTGGNLQGDTRNLQLMNKEVEEMEVMVTFTDEHHATHTLERVQQDKKTTITLDGEVILAKDLARILPPKWFLVSFNPMYFQSLEPEVARQLVASILPRFTKQDVMARLGKTTQDWLANELFTLEQVNDKMREIRQQLNQLEQKVTYEQGVLKGLEVPVAELEVLTIDPTVREALEQKLQAVEEKEKNYIATVYDQTMVQFAEELSILSEQGKTIKESTDTSVEQYNALKKEQTHLEAQRQLIEKQVYRGGEEDEAINQLNMNLMEQRMLYTKQQDIVKQVKETMEKLKKEQETLLQATTCPTCTQTMSSELKKKLNEQVNRTYEEQLSELEKKVTVAQQEMASIQALGKETKANLDKKKEARNEQVVAFEKEKEKKQAELTKQQDQVATQLEQLTAKAKGFVEDKNQRLEAVRKEYKEKQAKKEAFVKEHQATVITFTKEKQAIQQELKEYLVKAQAVETRLALIKQNQEQKTKQALLSQSKVKEIEDLTKEQLRLTNLLEHYKLFNAEKTLLMGEIIQKELTHVTLRLEKTVASTGETKEVFELLYDNKELKVCSMSETIRAGLEVAGFIQRMIQVNYPIFIDNAESITTYQLPTNQILQMSVEKGVDLPSVAV